jgi:Na+/H+ antiporter NhaD/arsenite permease-like protein
MTAITVAIFAATYIGLAIGRLPGLQTDRAGIALTGGALMLAVGALGMDEAARAVNVDTLALLLGLMILVGNLRLSGFFGLVNSWVVAHARHPLQLLAAVTLSSGVFSAFLLNDAICLVMTPIVLAIVVPLRRDPVPYLLAVAMASNIGSSATITGNPQNILIGSFSGISYGSFAAALSPVAAAGLVLSFALIALLHPAEFRGAPRLNPVAPAVRLDRWLIAKSLVVTVAMMAAFFAGQPPAKVALIAGGAMLLARHVRSERVYHEIDWPLLLMFAGLHLDQTPMLSAVSAGMANLVSNVPAVLVLRPFVDAAADPQHAWLVVAMASTLAGNLTILGSVANLIVVQGARSHGVAIGFWAYFRVGAPLTVLTILVGACWLSF